MREREREKVEERRKSAGRSAESSDQTKEGEEVDEGKKAAGGRIKRFSVEIQATGMHCITGKLFNKTVWFNQSHQSGIKQFVKVKILPQVYNKLRVSLRKQLEGKWSFCMHVLEDVHVCDVCAYLKILPRPWFSGNLSSCCWVSGCGADGEDR